MARSAKNWTVNTGCKAESRREVAQDGIQAACIPAALHQQDN